MSKNIEHDKDYDKKKNDQAKMKKQMDEYEKKIYVDRYKNNYIKYKDVIKENRKNKIVKWECECGRKMNSDNKESHLKTKLHKSRMEYFQKNLILDPNLTETSDEK